MQPNVNYRKGDLKMSKVIRNAKPIVEATLVSVVLMGAALAVPAGIIYAVT